MMGVGSIIGAVAYLSWMGGIGWAGGVESGGGAMTIDYDSTHMD